jgi:hypothetical protein
VNLVLTTRLMASIRQLVAILILAIGLSAFGSAWAFAQTAESPSTENGSASPPTLNIDRLPIDITKIQRALSRPPAIKLETNRTVFRVEIFGRTPTIEDILGPDYLKGPVPGGVMTHQEFLNMVTPKDVQGYAAFDNKQALTVAATSFALKWALQKAVDKYQSAKNERAREAARREVEEALAELRRARRAAGLPDK